jgi:hypothetical protein
MATFNGYSVVRRWNRPSVLLKTMLEMYFANNGSYFHPYSVSEVYILPDTHSGTTPTNGSPDIYINRQASDIGTQAYGLLNATGLSSVRATYNVSNGGEPQNPTAYSGGGTSAASAIFSGLSLNDGYQVIADGAVFTDFSAVGDYFDVWLVKDFTAVDASAGWQLYWNKFSVYSDRIVTFTEPYQITTHNKLQQKYLQLSSIPTLRITTDVFVANRNMAQDLKEIWRESVIDNVQIRIRKRNPQTTGLMSEIVEWTSSNVDISSDDTILYKWNTEELSTGDYTVQVKYTLLEQTFVSEEFSLVLR